MKEIGERISFVAPYKYIYFFLFRFWHFPRAHERSLRERLSRGMHTKTNAAIFRPLFLFGIGLLLMLFLNRRASGSGENIRGSRRPCSVAFLSRQHVTHSPPSNDNPRWMKQKTNGLSSQSIPQTVSRVISTTIRVIKKKRRTWELFLASFLAQSASVIPAHSDAFVSTCRFHCLFTRMSDCHWTCKA